MRQNIWIAVEAGSDWPRPYASLSEAIESLRLLIDKPIKVVKQDCLAHTNPITYLVDSNNSKVASIHRRDITINQ